MSGRHCYDAMWLNGDRPGTLLIPFRPAFTGQTYWQRVAVETTGIWTMLDQVQWKQALTSGRHRA